MPPKRKAPAPSTKVMGQSTNTTDFSKLSVAKLKEECKARSLDASGKKADLLKRYVGVYLFIILIYYRLFNFNNILKVFPK